MTLKSNPMPPGYIEDQYKTNRVHRDGRVEHSEDMDPVLDFIDNLTEAPESILFIGCRTGYEMEAFQAAFPTTFVTGIDIVPEFIEECRTKGLRAFVRDMHKLFITSGSFEWIYSVGTLEHAYDAPKAVSEMKRVARNLYVTADLEEPGKHLRSHYSASPDPEDWLALFRGPEWDVQHEVKGKVLWIRATKTM